MCGGGKVESIKEKKLERCDKPTEWKGWEERAHTSVGEHTDKRGGMNLEE